MITQDEIRFNAKRLEQAGASPDEIRKYVVAAVAELKANPQENNLAQPDNQGPQIKPPPQAVDEKLNVNQETEPTNQPSRLRNISRALALATTGGQVTSAAPLQKLEENPIQAAEEEKTLFARPAIGMSFPQRIPTRSEVGTAVRFGVPAVATLAAAPFVGPGALGVGALSGIGAVAGYGSSLLGQAIADEDVDQKTALSDAMLSAMPMASGGRAVARIPFNIASGIGTIEASEAILDGEYRPPNSIREAFKDWGFVAGLGAISGLAGRAAEKTDVAANKLKNISQERFGGSVMISELFPSLNPLESRVLAAGNKNARDLMNNMGAGFSDYIAVTYPSGVTNKPLRDYLAVQKEILENQQNSTRLAVNAAKEAQERANSLATGNNLQAYVKAKNLADVAALNATTAQLTEDYVKRGLLGQNTLNSFDVGVTAQINAVNQTMDSARRTLRNGINNAYEQANIGPNSTILDLNGALSAIASSSRSASSKIKGRGAKTKYRAFVKSYFEENGTRSKPGGPKDQLSLEFYQQMQKALADKMAVGGELSSLNQAQSGEVYRALGRASNRFLERINPEKAQSYKIATALASDDFLSRETQAMTFLREGDVDNFYSAISKEGRGETIADITEFAKLLAKSGDKNAAQAFVASVNDVISKGILNKATKANLGQGLDEVANTVDVNTLVTELDKLRALKFPIEQLSFGGSIKEIKAAARLNSVRPSGRVTPEQLDEFLVLAEKIGVPKATAKMNYYNAVRNEQIANGTRTQRLTSYRTRMAAKEAGANAEDAIQALALLEKDPIIRVINDRSFKLPSDPTNSAKFYSSLLSMEPDTASSFAEALVLKGKQEDLSNIKKNLLYQIMGQQTTDVTGRQSVNVSGISDFFFETGNPRLDNQRDVFRRIVGDDEYKNIKNNVVTPLRKIGDVQKGLNQAEQSSLPQARGRVGGNAGVTNISLLITPNFVKQLIDEKRYNLLYTLYVNPDTARMYRDMTRAGRDISSQPVLITAVRLAEERDRNDAEMAANAP